MSRRLAVLLAGVRVGLLSQDRRTEFTYDVDYLSRPAPTPLSLSMPLRPETYAQAQTMPWLDGLLPDRLEVRERWAREFGVSARNPFALVAEMGRDCPGAVQICPEDAVDDVAADQGELRPVTGEQIARRLEALRRDIDSWTVAGERWSLGGAQAKFVLVEATAGGTRPPAHSRPPTS